MTAILPLPEQYLSLNEWANALVAQLNPSYQVQSDGSTNGPGGTSLPIYDAKGRVTVDINGVYAYNAFGDNPIAPDIVQIDTSDLVDAAVSTAKLADSSVETTKIANAAVGTAQIANLAVTEALIGNGAIVNAKIADLAVNDAKIANGTITSAKINDLAAGKITAGTIGAHIIYLGDTTFELNGSDKTLTITDTQGAPVERVKIGRLGTGDANYGIVLKDDSGATILSSGTSTTGVVYSGNQITSGNVSTYIASAAIGTAYIADAAITNAKIGSLAVSNAKIENAAITTAKIADANITTLKIGANQVTIPVSSYASGLQTIGTSWATLRSAAVTPGSGNKVFISCSCGARGSDNTIFFRVLRGATVVYESASVAGQYLATGGFGVPLPESPAFTLSDTPGASTYTYSFQARCSSGAADIYNRSLAMIATKR